MSEQKGPALTLMQESMERAKDWSEKSGTALGALRMSAAANVALARDVLPYAVQMQEFDGLRVAVRPDFKDGLFQIVDRHGNMISSTPSGTRISGS